MKTCGHLASMRADDYGTCKQPARFLGFVYSSSPTPLCTRHAIGWTRSFGSVTLNGTPVARIERIDKRKRKKGKSMSKKTNTKDTEKKPVGRPPNNGATLDASDVPRHREARVEFRAFARDVERWRDYAKTEGTTLSALLVRAMNTLVP